MNEEMGMNEETENSKDESSCQYEKPEVSTLKMDDVMGKVKDGGSFPMRSFVG